VLDPAAISLIASVDVNAINAAAQRIQAAGQDIDTAGRRINTAWGGLGAVYHAPEAGQLYAAMNPVQQQASEFSRQADEVAAALRFFAAEAAQLKARAQSLAGAVEHFNTWSSHHNHIWDNLSGSKNDTETQLQADAANLQVAWWEAQTRCANRINALDGGPHYIPAPPGGANPALAVALGALNQQYYGTTSIPDGMDVGWGVTDYSAQPWWEQALGHLLNTNPAVSYQHLILGEGDAAFHMLEGTWDLAQPLSPRFVDAWKGVALLGIATSPLLSAAAMKYAPSLNKQAGQALTNFGKSFVYADDWRKDPAKAIGGLGFNLASLVTPDTAASSLGKLGEAGRLGDAATAARALADAEQASRTVDFANQASHADLAGISNLTDFREALQQLNDGHPALSGHNIPLQIDGNPPAVLGEHPAEQLPGTPVHELNRALQDKYGKNFGALDHARSTPVDPHEPRLNNLGTDQPAETGTSSVDHGSPAGHDHPVGHTDHPTGQPGTADHPVSGTHDDTGIPPNPADPSGSAGWQGEGGLHLSPADNAAADQALAHAHAAEPHISDAMKALAHRTPGGKLQGFEYRIKTEDSFKRKLATYLKENPRENIAGALADSKDTIRYTVELPDSSYVSGVRNAVRDLAAEGYRNIKFGNTWGGAPRYRGINAVWIDPKTGQKFEVQFHTPESFSAKMETHDFYDKIRLPGTPQEEVDHLIEEQNRIFGAIPTPDGAPQLRIDGQP